MKHRRFILLLLVLFCLLWLTQSVGAMSSTNYRLEWFTATSSGGGPATSAHYAANFTVGQPAIGPSTSTNYKVGLGYWYGMAGGYRIYLPLILK